MDSAGVLERWMAMHGELTPAQQRRFLEDPELEALAPLPDAAVSWALSRSANLGRALAIARRDGWWFAGDPCAEDNIAFCARCKPHAFPTTVYMTRGWSAAFHRKADCSALAAGQRAVSRNGGTPADITAVHVQTALGSGRFPCLVCFPPDAP